MLTGIFYVRFMSMSMRLLTSKETLKLGPKPQQRYSYICDQHRHPGDLFDVIIYLSRVFTILTTIHALKSLKSARPFTQVGSFADLVPI